MIDEILEFWFGKDFLKNPLQNAEKWFTKNPQFDLEVSENFKSYLPLAQEGKLDEWKNTPHGSLAFILLTDQFPRNIFRNQKTSFSFDSLALSEAKQGVARDFHTDLHWIERSFYYLPYEHSENLKDQEMSMLLFQGLVMDTPKPLRDHLEEAYDYSVKHWEIIKRFGRFPHRNLILKRESSPEEIEFLKEPGSSF